MDSNLFREFLNDEMTAHKEKKSKINADNCIIGALGKMFNVFHDSAIPDVVLVANG